MKCKRCGYQWKSELKRPKTCPRCKSYFWDEEKKNEVNKK